MRILDNTGQVDGDARPAVLGRPTSERFREAITRPHGMILATGPTGSGKSTTLYTALRAVANPKINVITVEDPVEYRIAGINQVQVNNRAGLTFANALRSILRSDPDVVLVGEIRDFETANISIEAALTGHLVLSTLHTNDAPSALTRLTEIGCEPFLVATALTRGRRPAPRAPPVHAVPRAARRADRGADRARVPARPVRPAAALQGGRAAQRARTRATAAASPCTRS